MPEVSFYILNSNSEQQRLAFTCKLVEKIYRTGRNVYILTQSEIQSRQLDDLLWTFRAGSFVPHQVFSGTPPSAGTPVLIGALTAPPEWQNTLINLSDRVPDELQKFDRIVEILDNNESIKQAGRNRYRDYQRQHCNTNTHKIRLTAPD